MDDDDRAELDRLRRAAYGPGSGLADGADRGRLAELEEQARLARAPGAPAAPPDGGDADTTAVRESGPEPARGGSDGSADAGEHTHDVRDAEGGPPHTVGDIARHGSVPARPGRSARRLVVVAATALAAVTVAAVALAVGADRTEETESAADTPAAVVLERIAVEGPLGNSIAVDLADEWPVVPVDGTVDWASDLGYQYGWNLWIYGIETPDGRRHCLLLERRGNVRYACETIALAARGALHLTLPTSEIAVALRPPGAATLDFQWRADGVIVVSAVRAVGRS